MSTTSSRKCLSCAAVAHRRSRDCPFATAGNNTGVARTPLSKSRRAKVSVSSSLPKITGIIGVVLNPVLKPKFCNSVRRNILFSHSLYCLSGSLVRILRDARADAVAAGDSAAEKMYGEDECCK